MTKFNYPDNLAAYLYGRFRWFERHIIEQLKKSKYNYLTISQIRVFPFLRKRDMNISDLAKLLNISRQAVQKTVSTLLDRGLVELTESPDNLSAKLINPTAEGKKLQAWTRRVVKNAEKKLTEKIGQDKIKLLKELLSEDWD